MTSIDAPILARWPLFRPIERVQALLRAQRLSSSPISAARQVWRDCAIEAAVEAFRPRSAGGPHTGLPRLPYPHCGPATHLREEIAASVGARVPVVANVTGELYPESRDEILTCWQLKWPPVSL